MSYDPSAEPEHSKASNVAPLPLPASIAASPSALDSIQRAYLEWAKRTNKEPDFLVCSNDGLKELRRELALALKQEMPSIDEMRKVSARGELVIGGFVVVFGPQYGAGVWTS